MIILDKYEKQWILLIKGQLLEKYPHTGKWVENLKPLFTEIYGWNPDEDNNYNDYLRGMFNKLFDILLKIKEDWSGTNQQLKKVFYASFNKNMHRDDELPIERAISELCGLIQCTSVLDEKRNKRFDLTLE